MSKIVEIHVPLDPRPGLPSDAYQFPWIEEIEEFLAEQEEEGKTEVCDDGGELAGFYIFSITGGTEREMLEIANKVAALPDIPKGVVAYVAENEDETFGEGRRVELPFRG